ncbi:hypothetical protein [Flavobacterium sp. CAU 1735]|uniref:hypothetical protein n=1 Tax=Flavobacterium sp. CAU 1735 TaxID=3140361 RepID=UPI00326148C8
MKRILFLLLSILTISCNDTKSTKISNTQKTDTVSKNNSISEKQEIEIDSTKIIEVGYHDNYEKLPKLTFDTITEKEFLSLGSKKYIQTFKPKQKGDFFYIQTALKKHTFKKYNDYGGEESWNGYEHLGYYPDFKLFAITQNSTSDYMGFGQLILLDSTNDYKYTIISFGDGSVELPIPSINNKYFVYFYNSVYEHKNSDIGILKINDKSNPKKYMTEYASYNSKDFAIEKIIWKTDNSFFVKGYEEVYENDKWVKKYKYYKTEFQ